MSSRDAGGRHAVAPPAATGPLTDPVAWAYLAAVLLAGIQAVVLGSPGRTLAAAGTYLLALAVTLAVPVAARRLPVAPDAWLGLLAGMGVVLAIWVVVAFLLALPEGVGASAGFYRVKLAVTSPVGDHNTAAGLLLAPTVAAAVLAPTRPRWRLGLVVLVLGLVATLSRGGALVLLALGVLGLGVLGTRRARAWLLAAGALALTGVLALALVLGAAPPGEVAEPDGPVGVSVLGRVDLAVRGVEVGAEHPALGVGMGAFGEHAGDLPQPNDHAHQLLAHALAEGGVVLLAVTLLVPVVLARRVLRLPADARRDVLLLGGLGLVGHAQIEILGGRVGYEVLLALLAAIAAAPRPSESTAPSAS